MVHMNHVIAAVWTQAPRDENWMSATLC